MSREIIEFVQELERDKGIESDTLIEALEDALLAAYKKTPGASRHAVVELDRDEGDFRVFSIELPPDIEERLLEEARERVLTELEQAGEVDGERYEQGSRIKAVITEVRSGTKGPQVILSRRDPELIKTLFELEVPEIADGLVDIRAVAREPGYRSKIAVESHAQGVDPVGACVGPRGSRVRMVVSELRGEKIDIIPWNPEPARFVAKALSPARVREVYLDDEAKEATVVTPDDQLALAIGKEGMNARLAARLTGWKIDIQSDTEFAQAEAAAAFGGGEEGAEDFSGRCAAVLANGKRCPNTALPGSRFCGVPAHQALEGTGTDYVAGPPPEAEAEEAEEIETQDGLADAAGVTAEATDPPAPPARRGWSRWPAPSRRHRPGRRPAFARAAAGAPGQPAARAAPARAAADRSRLRRVRRQRPRPLAGARRLDAEHHQDPHGSRADAHGDAVAKRRGGRADRDRGRPGDHDQARRRRGRGARGVRRPRRRPPGAASGRHDHGPRRPRQDDTPRRDPQRTRRGHRGRRHHAAHRGLPGRRRRPQDHLPRYARPRGV